MFVSDTAYYSLIGEGAIYRNNFRSYNARAPYLYEMNNSYSRLFIGEDTDNRQKE